MRQKVKLPLEYRRFLGLVDHCGHVSVLRSLLGRFSGAQVEAWLQQFENLRLVEYGAAPEIAVSVIGQKMAPPPVEPEDNTFYEDVSAFADISLSRMGVYLSQERICNREPSPKTVDRTRALVVEDDPDQLALAVRRLTEAGYRVDTADRVTTLLGYLQARTPDAIFLDINLPDGNGFGVLAGVRSHPSFTHVPVVMLTVKTERADIAKGLALGADAYVTKPYGTNTLEYVLRYLMKQEVEVAKATNAKLRRNPA
jgi:CheY-like chemotaxis protein